MRAEALKGHLDGLILATLKEGPAHGYAVAQALRARSGGTFDLPEGTLYPALHRLERAGFVSSEWSTEAGRRRRTYRLTRSGAKTLEERRHEWRALSSAIEAVLA
ncbi:MAG TPA: PadR family transcriptional regulator [Solirubrobacteraceae bacterium]|jgi:transcriptional regulator